MLNFKKIALTLSFILFFSEYAFSQTPVIFFSDLESGPKTGWEGSLTKGAAVTVWGKYFGTTRGNSYVTVNGVQLTDSIDYAEWGVTTGNAREMERITFWINSNMESGAGLISVNVGGDTSNSVPFTVRSGNIYFVDDVGNDGWDGQYSTSQSGTSGPWATPQRAKNSMSAGDIVYIRAGTYSDDRGDRGVLWFSGDREGGATGNPIAFVGYPGERPKIQKNNGYFAIGSSYYNTLEWILISKIEMDGSGQALDFVGKDSANGTRHIRIVGNDMTGNNRQWEACAVFQGDIEDLKFFGNEIHDYGAPDKHNHGLYIGGYGTQNNVEIGWNEIHDIVNGRGLQVYGHKAGDTITNLVVHDNEIYDSEKHGMLFGGGDGGSGDFVKNAKIYNNLIYRNGLTSQWGYPGLSLRSTAGSFEVYHNTLYGNGRLDDDYQIEFDNAISVILKNNIIYAVGNQTFIRNNINASKITASNNLYYGQDSIPSFDSDSIQANPKMFDPAGYDFHLQPDSPAIEAGVDSGIAHDHDGNPRPMDGDDNGTAIADIGAYEYPGIYVPPPPDTTPPSIPQTLVTNTQSGNQIDLSWTASTDDVGVTGYRIYRDGTVIATTTTTTYSDTGLSPSTTYSYTVSAYDAAGNESGQSTASQSTTTGDTIPPIISSASVSSDTKVTITFSESVDLASATNVSNYSINNGIIVSGASLGSDLKTVTLTTSPHTGNGSYTLTVNNIKDRANIPNVIASNTQATYTFPSQIVINNLTVASGKTYEIVQNGLQNGLLVYIDRTYTYSSVPILVDGAMYIKTANDDKNSSGASFITFDVNQNVTVYVAHDDRITTKPSWMVSFSDTGDNLVTTDTTLSIFANDYLAGTITLGGNESGGNSMYTVIIAGQGTGPVSDTTPPATPMGLTIQ